MQQQYGLLCSNRNRNDAKRIEFFIKVCLELLTVLALWMNVDHCFNPDHDFLSVFCVLIRDESHSIRMEACIALNALASRKTFTEPPSSFINPEAAVMRIVESCKQINLNAQSQFPINESFYEYQKKVVRIITSLARHTCNHLSPAHQWYQNIWI